ncbi:MAG: ATP synthase subunit C [Promethearchaeota archaeon]
MNNGKRNFYILMFFFQIVLIFAIVLFHNAVSGAAYPAQDPTNMTPIGGGMIAIGAGLAVGLSGIGAGIAIKTTGTAAISVLTEQPENFMKSFLIVALGEGLAVYGLVVAIMLLGKI